MTRTGKFGGEGAEALADGQLPEVASVLATAQE
jgi:hypothetical protein